MQQPASQFPPILPELSQHSRDDRPITIPQELVAFLTFCEAKGAAQSEVRAATDLIARDGLELLTDLAFRFTEPRQASQAGMQQIWTRARATSRGDDGAAKAFLRSLEELKKHAAPVRARRRHLEAAAKPPRSKATSTVGELKDEQARTQAALHLVKLSITWAPRAGLAAGELFRFRSAIARPNSTAVKFIALFELKTIKYATREWGLFEEWCRQAGLDPAEDTPPPPVTDLYVDQAAQTDTGKRAA